MRAGCPWRASGITIGAAIFLAFLTTLAAAGALYQAIGAARQRRLFVAPGHLVDLGGHRVHVLCTGAGPPAVVFESGIAASSLSWSLVQPAVAEFTHACPYDRAGLGWSDAPSSPRTFDRIVEECRALVAGATAGGECAGSLAANARARG